MKLLTKENAGFAKAIRCIAHPEWGVWRLNKNAQPLNDGKSIDVIMGESGSKILSKGEYHFWEVVESENEGLQNGYVSIIYRAEKKEISMQDLTDKNNLPAGYNRTRRGIAKAFLALKKAFNEKTTMYCACDILRENGLQMHTYCMMD